MLDLKIAELEDRIKKLEVENKILKSRYGLVWEDIKEDFNNTTIENLTFVEKTNNRIFSNNDYPNNILIEGENYFALQLLLEEYRNKISTIIIDPPYNTGNKNFIYNDNFTNKTSEYRHSYWLSFMNRRLLLSKELLKDDGVILIHIDDNEYSNLKLLCDKIFGETNYVNTLYVKKTTKNANSQFKEVKSLNQIIEFVLVYRKTKLFSYMNAFKETTDKRKGGYWKSFITTNGERPTMQYSIGGVKPSRGRWKWNEERGLKAYGNYIEYEQNFSHLSLKEYWDIYHTRYEQENDCPLDFVRTNNNKVEHWVKPSDKMLMDNNMLEYYINDNYGKLEYGFDTVKNLSTETKLLDMFCDKNALILDFFAGSGTIGHATLKLNEQDNGNRTFILITNNENNICSDICYPRMKKILNGYTNNKGKYVGSLKGNLQYLKIE